MLPDTCVGWASRLVHVNRDLSGFATSNDTLRTGLQWRCWWPGSGSLTVSNFHPVGDNMVGGMYSPSQKPPKWLAIYCALDDFWDLHNSFQLQTHQGHIIRVHNPWAVNIFTIVFSPNWITKWNIGTPWHSQSVHSKGSKGFVYLCQNSG